MIGLDTNVLVRYLTQDHPEQSAAATDLITGLDEDDQGYVSVIVLVELVWVLERAYRASAEQIDGVVRGLLDAREIQIQDAEVVARALARRVPGVGLADALIVEYGRRAGCTSTVTFDRRAAQLTDARLL